MSTRFVHLSDLHIGRQPERKHEEQNLDKAVQSILAQGWNKDDTCLIVTGDMGDDGAKQNFSDAKAILQPLYDRGFTLLVVPGNHDYKDDGWGLPRGTFAYFCKVFYGATQSFPVLTRFGGHALIGLDSTGIDAHKVDLARGALGPQQLQALSALLDQTRRTLRPEQRLIVHLHHHPFKLPEVTPGEDGPMELEDGAQLRDVIRGKADILLFGHWHFHRDFSGTVFSQQLGIPFIFSAGKTTEKGTEYPVGNDGMPDKNSPLHQGRLARVIEIADNGDVSYRTITL